MTGAEAEFQILGRLEVLRGGHVIEISGLKERGLLALLVINANRVVSLDRLVEDLWAGDPPEQAVAVARVYVSRLRKTLGPELIATRAPGYELRVDPRHIDATRFEALASPAHRLLKSGRAHEAAVAFRDALALWRGPALADVADLPFARPEVTRLEELRLAVLEGRIEADLACGRHAELVGELGVLTEEHPLREGFWAARMLALYHSGRQAEALRAYQAARVALANVGVEPGPGLARVEREILAHEVTAPRSRPATTLGNAEDAPSRVVTLLFTDVVASTEILDRLSEAATEALRREHFGLLRRAVAAHDGEEVKNLGDGVMVVFASAVDAVACAVEMQQAVARHNRRHVERSLQVRIGLHVGEPIQDEADYFGTPVVVAKRLCDHAQGGQILASGLVVSLVGSREGFSFSEFGGLALKGLADPVAAYEVSWTERPAVRFPLPVGLAGEGATFVGRQVELARAQSIWEKAEGGQRQVLMVAGEPGIGKTTLAAQLARGAHAAGAKVLFGRCEEESVVPFQPFVEALSQYARVCPASELRAQAGEAAADLGRLVPELCQRLPKLAQPEGVGSDTERYRIFEAVTAFLVAIAAQAPVVVVLDDLHWADRPTLQLLLHVVRRTPTTPMLVLGTYRDTDLVRTHPMAEALVELRRVDLTERIVLRGLGAEDIAALVAGGASVEDEDRSLGQALWAQTEGSPLFVREILRHLSETDAVMQEADGRFRARGRLEQLGLPEGIKEVIGRRLTGLDDGTNAALRTASVMGREFRANVVARVNGTAIDTVLDALDEAAAAGVVAEVPGVAGSYAFTHALVRETLYDELSLTRRVLVHQRVAETIEALHADDLDPYLAELAYHFTQSAVAGQAAKAIAYARRAGERAMALVAYEEAARHFTMALEVARDLGASEQQKLDLLLALGAAEWRTRDTEAARASFEQAAEGARRLGDAQRLARAALGFTGTEVRWMWVSVVDPNRRAVELLEEALSALGPDDNELRARVLGSLAQELTLDTSARKRREQLSLEAVAIARRLGDAATLSWVLCARNGTMLGNPDTIDEVLANVDEVLGVATALGDATLASLAQQHLFPALLQRGDLPGARDAHRRAVEMARALRDPVLMEHNLHREGLLATLEGRFDEAQALHEEAFRIGQDARDPNAFGLMGAATTVLMWLRGRLEEVVGGFELAVGSFPVIWAGGASLRADLGHEAECRKWVELVEVGDLGPPFFPFDAYNLARACAFLGDRSRCRQLYDLLEPYAAQNAQLAGIGCNGSVSRVLGMMASVLGRHRDASRHFEETIAQHRTNGWAPLVALTQLDYAAAVLAEGGPGSTERVEELLNDALETGRRLDMRDVVRRSGQLLDEAHGRNRLESRSRGRVSRRDMARARITSGGRRAAARFLKGSSDENVARRLGSAGAQRALFRALAKAFQPAMASGFTGDIVFELAGRDEDSPAAASTWWTIEVRGAKATARPGGSEHAALTMHTDVASFVHLALGDLDLTTALFWGRVWAEGDFLLLFRLGTMFGAVAPFEVAEEQP